MLMSLFLLKEKRVRLIKLPIFCGNSVSSLSSKSRDVSWVRPHIEFGRWVNFWLFIINCLRFFSFYIYIGIDNNWPLYFINKYYNSTRFPISEGKAFKTSDDKDK